MYSIYDYIYDAALKAHFDAMRYAAEFVPFGQWLEQKKSVGLYWGA